MNAWVKTCILLCAVGFFKSLRPAEAFLTQYLLGPPYNLTNDEVYYHVYPVATYSNLSVVLIILLITDYLRYKPIIILEAATLAATYITLIWGNTLWSAQVLEFLYATSTSSEVAYYTYIYAEVPGDHYQKVTGYTRAAVLTGFFMSGVIGQSLVTTKALDFGGLNYITLFASVVTIGLALLLPKPAGSIYFHSDSVRRPGPDSKDASENPTYVDGNSAELAPAPENASENQLVQSENYENPIKNVLKRGFWSIRRDVKESYRNSVIKWSFWWACGTCLNYQIGNYIQPLWEDIHSFRDHDIYNGAVESVSTLLGAASALAIGYISCDWSKYGEFVLTSVSALSAACLLIMAGTANIWLAYSTYVIYRSSYQMVLTIASYQVAKDIRPDTYGLIFGCNTFFALIMQAVLTLIVVDDKVLALPPRIQFRVYGGFAAFLALVFLVTGLVRFFVKKNANAA